MTVERIISLCNRFHSDLGPLSKLSREKFFDYVRSIPYRRDPKSLDDWGNIEGIEVIARPAVLIEHQDVGLDCKKKCILMVSYAIENGIPYRIVTSSRRPDKNHHHIFPQWKIGGDWKNADATYDFYRLGECKELTDFIIYGAK